MIKAGTMIEDRYEIIELIGTGGMSDVYKAKCHKLNRFVAVKVLKQEFSENTDFVTKFRTEARAAAGLEHPNIVNVYDVGEQDGMYYIIMELVEGITLKRYIEKKARLSVKEAVSIAIQISMGIEAAHNKQIIHRDIKPQNVLILDDGRLKITDFGIAKIQQPGNARETSGTPGYMSPEVMCAQDHTIAVDYFAVGVIGFEFMKGIRPYLGKSRKEIKEKMMAHQAQIKRQEIPDGWSLQGADCINRMLQRKPMNRLGVHGAQEVKEHPWFNDFNWKELYNMKMESPFIPRNTDNFDYKYCNQVEKIGLQTQERYRLILEREDYESAFNDYFYFNRVNIEKKKSKGEKIELEMYDNPHKVYEEGENINANLSAHYRNKSYDDGISTHKKIPMHVSNNSMNAFYAANSYIIQRNSMKKSMASLTSTGSGITTGQGTGNSNNSTGFGFK